MSERLQPRTSRISCQKDLKIVMRSSCPSRSMLVATPHSLRALTRQHQNLKSDHSPWLRQLGLQLLGWSTAVFCWVIDDDVNLWSRSRWKTKTVEFQEFHESFADLCNTFVLRLRLLKIAVWFQNVSCLHGRMIILPFFEVVSNKFFGGTEVETRLQLIGLGII